MTEAGPPAPPLPVELDAAVTQACARAAAMHRQGLPVREVLTWLATSAETLAPERTVSSILVLDAQGLLRNGASPNVPADYLAAIDRLAPDAAVGTCASAAATGRVVVTRSFLAAESWVELRHWPLSCGFRSAWSFPIKAADGRVLGTFGSYFFDEREPTALEQEIVRRLAAPAAAALADA
jgi:GAF domain-containing protein